MPSSSRALSVVALLVFAGQASGDPIQQQAQGFAVDRLYPSAPGGGWFVMDDLDIHGRLGGDIGITLGHASSQLRVTDGTNRVAVVSDQVSADIGAAVTYQRWRFYLNLDTPILISGQSGTVGDYAFAAPSVSLGSHPDVISDVRVGTDVRLVGKPGGRFRFGAGAQLIIPNGERIDYDSDGTFRGMIRALAAGDARYFTYAAQLGVHIRALDDTPTPGTPRGSELLFGVAAGAKVPLTRDARWVAIFGPEVYCATAFRSFLQRDATALEGLLTGRFEGTRTDKMQMRVRIGVGAGLNRDFGAAEWRIIAGVEMFNHREQVAR